MTMFTTLSKKPALLLSLLLVFASYFVFSGQQTKQAPLTDANSKQGDIPDNAKLVSIRPVSKASQPHLFVNATPRQEAAERGLSPQDWLAAFKNAYPADHNAVDKLMNEINAELRPDFIEQLLQQVQFLADGDPVGDALENMLTMKLANLDPPRAADYVLAVITQQKQTDNVNSNLLGAYSGMPLPQLNMPGQQFMMRHQLISSLMQAWGDKDLSQAIDWALALDDEQLKHEALNLLSYTRDEYKIDKMTDAINRLPDGNARSGLLTQLAEQKAQIDPEAAVVWVSNWPDSAERNKAVSALIGSRTSQSLEDTATLVERALAAGMSPDETAIDMLVNQWQYKSHDEAYQWASNLPDSAVKTRALLLLDAFKAEADAQE
ncbi:MAG: hypothetical protein HOO93_02885 [Methyloglobulus sp.]|nr:hypothetical protein [Methyloglobulus sp.]